MALPFQLEKPLLLLVTLFQSAHLILVAPLQEFFLAVAIRIPAGLQPFPFLPELPPQIFAVLVKLILEPLPVDFALLP